MPDLYGTRSSKSLTTAIAVAGVLIFLFLVGVGVMLWYYLRSKPSSQIDALYPRDVESARTFIPSSTTAIAVLMLNERMGWNEKAPSTTAGSSEESLKSGNGGAEGQGEKLGTPQVETSRCSSASDMSQNLDVLKPVEPVAVVR
ncbi:hypothetical protein L873DRAFT_1716541 [Choiromyces venosus 120613-1]|uniref:Uncharacterized protein n=1 Tax=Choiromyces venosus 120613-1 TaxID=1336337 RepID=A0A3N4J315_9PEZI|nr:hypothetical protein L873DRAFT_1716541 [Choiromyces venosus 120613-1]